VVWLTPGNRFSSTPWFIFAKGFREEDVGYDQLRVGVNDETTSHIAGETRFGADNVPPVQGVGNEQLLNKMNTPKTVKRKRYLSLIVLLQRKNDDHC
jgi:hypothetical protein